MFSGHCRHVRFAQTDMYFFGRDARLTGVRRIRGALGSHGKQHCGTPLPEFRAGFRQAQNVLPALILEDQMKPKNWGRMPYPIITPLWSMGNKTCNDGKLVLTSILVLAPDFPHLEAQGWLVTPLKDPFNWA